MIDRLIHKQDTIILNVHVPHKWLSFNKTKELEEVKADTNEWRKRQILIRSWRVQHSFLNTVYYFLFFLNWAQTRKEKLFHFQIPPSNPDLWFHSHNSPSLIWRGFWRKSQVSAYGRGAPVRVGNGFHAKAYACGPLVPICAQLVQIIFLFYVSF